MTITATRRGFLAGLLGTSVIAVLPKASIIADAAPALQPYEIAAPEGWTYQWVASHVMGEPTERNIADRLAAGWTFVAPATHPAVPALDIARAVEGGGLILMQKETHLIAPPRARTVPGIGAGLFQDHNRTYGRVHVDAHDRPHYQQDDGTWVSQEELIKRQGHI